MELNERIERVVWHQWLGNAGTNNGLKPVWEMWKVLHNITGTGEMTVASLLNTMYGEIAQYPKQSHFSVATGGLILMVSRDTYDPMEAYVTLAVTCHHVGNTAYAEHLS